MTFRVTLALVLWSVVPIAQSGLQPDPAINCSDCAAWNAPREAHRVFGNTYFVGVAGLSSVLIASEAGLVLLDGGLPQSAPLIDRSIRSLGFKTEDVRLILNSHAHFDHAGGIAALQRASGATVVTSAAGARALENGEPTPDDPQYALEPGLKLFPAVAKLRTVRDAEVLRVGDVAVTAHFTPGHTPGGTTWSWRSCEGATCRTIVYADSLTPVSAPQFRFTGDEAHASRVDEFRRSIAKMAALPCDILIAVHPQFPERRSCRSYAEAAGRLLEARIQQEKP